MSQGIAITPLDAAAILIVLAAALGYLNHRLLGSPAPDRSFVGGTGGTIKDLAYQATPELETIVAAACL